VKIYLKQILPCAPRKHDAALAAGISDEKLVTHEKRTGVFFHKPIRKFFGMRPMPDHMVRFLEEDQKYHRSGSSARSPLGHLGIHAHARSPEHGESKTVFMTDPGRAKLPLCLLLWAAQQRHPTDHI
jgi:hypothetical protein